MKVFFDGKIRWVCSQERGADQLVACEEDEVPGFLIDRNQHLNIF